MVLWAERNIWFANVVPPAADPASEHLIFSVDNVKIYETAQHIENPLLFSNACFSTERNGCLRRAIIMAAIV